MFSFLFRGFSKKAVWVPDPARKLVVYVGWPLPAPNTWKKAMNYSAKMLHLEDGTFVKPGEVKSHLLVYPNNEALGGANLFYPFPAGVIGLEPGPVQKNPPALDPAQIEQGKSICKVSHSRLRKNPEGKKIYATTVQNISGQRIRIQKFAAFSQVGQKHALNTVTRSPYTAEQFIAWFGAPADGWIPPGGKAVDDSNYGSGDGIWAYFGQTEDGTDFIATVPLPR
jgi:hypothetical protein